MEGQHFYKYSQQGKEMSSKPKEKDGVSQNNLFLNCFYRTVFYVLNVKELCAC